MKTLVNVARYHLLDRLAYFVMPWASPGIRVRRQFGNRRRGPEGP